MYKRDFSAKGVTDPLPLLPLFYILQAAGTTPFDEAEKSLGQGLRGARRRWCLSPTPRGQEAEEPGEEGEEELLTAAWDMRRRMAYLGPRSCRYVDVVVDAG